ncbi:unnamed protein product, partial [Ascophyllum nodosum]
ARRAAKKKAKKKAERGRLHDEAADEHHVSSPAVVGEATPQPGSQPGQSGTAALAAAEAEAGAAAAAAAAVSVPTTTSILDHMRRKDRSKTPLHLAATSGSTSLVSLLDPPPDDVLAIDADGCTPLHPPAA